ncbi:hypothetical protein Q0Z83_022050 [Actinoplanes sichuanensis]|uniref:Uncharacterized protein n=1 Tax=Actinoplanes sichuanensis TaxID=512349 RepID=A0ABW4AJZ9_9ACTN|nr:hypothetical protein [Actinoplanes sichuanensis]BEL04014.1 hypothetical protein Q0Z83_022050 [Actinoplanes sichuanensis]
MSDDDEDGLTARDLVPVAGGTWAGLLFDNPNIGLPPALTWSFRFPFAEVQRDFGDSDVFLDVDWLPLPVPSWRAMTGQVVKALGEPAECSVYYFQHHQYDLIDLEILEQRGVDLHVRATLTGDLDGLGIDPISADAWLRFDGIRVSVSDVTTAESALARLRTFTSAEGLDPATTVSHSTFHFRPADRD